MRSAPSARSRARLAAIGAAALALLAAAALAVRCRDDASSVRPRPAPVVGPEADPGGLAAPATLLGPHHDARARSADATLIVHIRDELGAPLPARLTFVGVDDTAAPAFTVTDIGRAEPGATLAFDRAFVTGDATLRVAPGHYDVWISHGPEWDAAVARVELVAGGEATLDQSLRRVVDTRGWLSADFHVHAEESFDSKVPMRDRVMQFVADGVDLIVSTDHNVIADYAPVIAELGLEAHLASLTGDEITTADWGHFGAFPLVPDDAEAGRGAIPVAGRPPAALFAEIRRRAPSAIIDVHHPRLEGGHIGYFHLAGLDPATLRARRAGFSRDFDAIEVLNGYQDGDRLSVDAVLEDWYAFLRSGQRVTATGNSDTHHLTFNLGGYPRNYVRVDDDRPAALDPAAVGAAIRAGRALFTTGPFVEATVGGQGPGDTVPAVAGAIELRIQVHAPRWIEVARVIVLVDGHRAIERRVSGQAPTPFDESLRVPIARDAFVIVRVEGDRPMAPIVGDLHRFRVLPFAVTNPIWVDGDGDGASHPPP